MRLKASVTVILLITLIACGSDDENCTSTPTLPECVTITTYRILLPTEQRTREKLRLTARIDQGGMTVAFSSDPSIVCTVDASSARSLAPSQ